MNKISISYIAKCAKILIQSDVILVYWHRKIYSANHTQLFRVRSRLWVCRIFRLRQRWQTIQQLPRDKVQTILCHVTNKLECVAILVQDIPLYSGRSKIDEEEDRSRVEYIDGWLLFDSSCVSSKKTVNTKEKATKNLTNDSTGHFLL